jgi:hypothetical protein
MKPFAVLFAAFAGWLIALSPAQAVDAVRAISPPLLKERMETLPAPRPEPAGSPSKTLAPQDAKPEDGKPPQIAPPATAPAPSQAPKN